MCHITSSLCNYICNGSALISFRFSHYMDGKCRDYDGKYISYTINSTCQTNGTYTVSLYRFGRFVDKLIKTTTVKRNVKDAKYSAQMDNSSGEYFFILQSNYDGYMIKGYIDLTYKH